MDRQNQAAINYPASCQLPDGGIFTVPPGFHSELIRDVDQVCVVRLAPGSKVL
jgi:hypothetical protein